jgi:hypothetical protein
MPCGHRHAAEATSVAHLLAEPHGLRPGWARNLSLDPAAGRALYSLSVSAKPYSVSYFSAYDCNRLHGLLPRQHSLHPYRYVPSASLAALPGVAFIIWHTFLTRCYHCRANAGSDTTLAKTVQRPMTIGNQPGCILAGCSANKLETILRCENVLSQPPPTASVTQRQTLGPKFQKVT